jgi:hypothetical protein
LASYRRGDKERREIFDINTRVNFSHQVSETPLAPLISSDGGQCEFLKSSFFVVVVFLCSRYFTGKYKKFRFLKVHSPLPSTFPPSAASGRARLSNPALDFCGTEALKGGEIKPLGA